MRSHMRVVPDEHVDRAQVQAWRHVQPSATNSPNTSRTRSGWQHCLQCAEVWEIQTEKAKCEWNAFPALSFRAMSRLRQESLERDTWWLQHGGPPLPIPNREVKPRRADDTALNCGKVGRRHPLSRDVSWNVSIFLCLFLSFSPFFRPIDTF